MASFLLKKFKIYIMMIWNGVIQLKLKKEHYKANQGFNAIQLIIPKHTKYNTNSTEGYKDVLGQIIPSLKCQTFNSKTI